MCKNRPQTVRKGLIYMFIYAPQCVALSTQGIKRSINCICLPKLVKLRCMHCDSKTLVSDGGITLQCNNCEGLLPLNDIHCDMATTINTLKGKRVTIDIGHENL